MVGTAGFTAGLTSSSNSWLKLDASGTPTIAYCSGYLFAKRYTAISILTGVISPAVLCAGFTLSVPYTISGTFNPGNIFTAQLSDANGSFASPVNIGSVVSTTSGTIPVIIPNGTPLGTSYRIRVISNNPAIQGTDNGSNISIGTGSFTQYYLDFDNDSYGDPTSSQSSCTMPFGYVVDNTDCNDANAAVNPAATEICNTIDDDCDGLVDDADPSITGQSTWYAEGDGDTYGNAGSSVLACVQPVGYVANNTDCNDGNAAVNPAATEVCNTIDDDCDGLVDDADPSITGQAIWYADVDNDGYGDANGTGVYSCNPINGSVPNNGDCNDGNASINPAAVELCNGIDDNCNGLVDDNVPALPNVGAIGGTAAACLPGVAGSASYSIAAVVGATMYVWSVPVGFTIASGQGSTSITVSWTATAIQNGITGQLCVYASNACVNSATSCVNINYLIAAPITPGSISGPGKACPGAVVMYSIATVVRATSYTWSVPTGMTIQSGQGTNVVNVQVNAGFVGGSISVTASNVCGTSLARSKSIVKNLPSTPSAIAGAKDGLCNTVGNIFSITPVANATGYSWGVTGTGVRIPVPSMGTGVQVDIALLTGSGSVTVQAVNGCGTSLVRSRTITGAPARAGVITGATSVCDNTNESYSVATVPGAALYTWAVTANGSVSTGQGTKNITIDWLAPAGGQSMSVVTSNACGTSLTRTLTGITVNNCIRLGSVESDVFNINAYPNPATDRVTIEFTAVENNDYRLRIADMTGRTLQVENGTSAAGLNTKVLPLNGIAAGVYMISIEMNNEQQQIKLVVE
ncbi:MAG: T9SS type A sorting domain-containing protein [Bacteroidetes bacterium]|nr:T9SS type A sorting domain-containing protein [Bacteroidota bacterium]